MAYTEFCCRSGGSNLNAGTLTGSSTEPGTAASFTYASGNWVASTGVFTVASGNPSSDGVAVGDFASVYADGSTVTGFVGRVTARDATTITVSLTAKSGTAPTDGTGNRTLKIGGAWAGPNGTSGFPFNFAQNTCTNSAADLVRVNFKNAATYSITAAMTHANIGMIFEGYTTSYGDGGQSIFDGGTSGASYVLLANSGVGCTFRRLTFQNNGATGTASGFTNSAAGVVIDGCVVNSVRGHGFTSSGVICYIACEAYSCNQSNNTNTCGFSPGTATLLNCISHDNTGSNASGYLLSANSDVTMIGCIADSNGAFGINISAARNVTYLFIGCELYNNTSDGIRWVQNFNDLNYTIQNCNFIKNGGYGLQLNSGTAASRVTLYNCGFGAGTQANTSGKYPADTRHISINEVNYASDVTPWTDPANGDFRISLAAAKDAGRGAYTQTAASYAGTIGYPDIGSAQHQDSGGAASILTHRGMVGGMTG